MTDDETDEPVVLSRRDRRRTAAEADGGTQHASAEVDDATVVVDRSGASTTDAADEATIVVDRSVAPTPDAPGEATIVVSRPDRRLRRKRSETTRSAVGTTTDVSAPGREAEPFSPPTNGPAPAIYKPRPAPLTPVAPPVVVGAAAPTRVADPELPSVAGQGRRWSLVALAAAAGACIVSVAGLIVLGFTVFG